MLRMCRVSITKVFVTLPSDPLRPAFYCPENLRRNLSEVPARNQAMERLLGYARVSTSDHQVRGQVDALNGAGCAQVWTDVASGARTHRPGLDELLSQATAGDTIVVTRLDRLGRSLAHLLSLVEQLAPRAVGLRSLAEQIDTTSATGRLVLHVFGALAEFERGLNHERTTAGLAAARSRGRVGGRPKALLGHRLKHAQELAAAGVPIPDIADVLLVGRSTVYRTLNGLKKREGTKWWVRIRSIECGVSGTRF